MKQPNALIAGMFCFVFALVRPLPAAEPPNDGFSQIAPHMQGFVDKGEVAGIVTIVTDKAHTLHLAAVGKSDIATGRNMQTDDLFWIASMSKPVTAVAIAILADEGKLTFDDPVEKYLPVFHKEGAIKPITLRHLLTHTSGLREYSKTDPHWTLDQMVRQIASQPVAFEPGARWSYSTAGIDSLGRVVEVISGMSFDEFLQKKLFDPLGMKQTTFWLTAEQEKHFAHNYRLNTRTSKLEETPIAYMYGGAITDRARPPLGGAGLFSTAEDVARFYQMVLGGGAFGSTRILKAQTVTEMLTKQTGSLTARPGMPWGLGFCIVEDPSALSANKMLTPGSYGHGGAHGTSSWVDPTRGIVYVIMLQRGQMRNPDDSDMHRVFQETASEAIGK